MLDKAEIILVGMLASMMICFTFLGINAVVRYAVGRYKAHK